MALSVCPSARLVIGVCVTIDLGAPINRHQQQTTHLQPPPFPPPKNKRRRACASCPSASATCTSGCPRGLSSRSVRVPLCLLFSVVCARHTYIHQPPPPPIDHTPTLPTTGVPSDVVIKIHPPVETKDRNENIVWREVRKACTGYMHHRFEELAGVGGFDIGTRRVVEIWHTLSGGADPCRTPRRPPPSIITTILMLKPILLSTLTGV